jgi:hypothetical protein
MYGTGFLFAYPQAQPELFVVKTIGQNQTSKKNARQLLTT